MTSASVGEGIESSTTPARISTSHPIPNATTSTMCATRASTTASTTSARPEPGRIRTTFEASTSSS